jgi:hypothetical protein
MKLVPVNIDTMERHYERKMVLGSDVSSLISKQYLRDGST